MDCYFIHERVKNGDVKPFPIQTQFQTVDIFAKVLGAYCFQFLYSNLEVRNVQSLT